MEKTYAMIKPDAVAGGLERDIMQIIELKGFQIVAQKRIHLTKKRAEEFYGEHQGKPFFEGLVEFMISGPVIALVLARENAILEWRSLMGPTNSHKAREEASTRKTLRALFGADGRRNACHGSDSPASAFREIKFFFPEVVVDPIVGGQDARDYMTLNLQTTLIKGLTQLARDKPSSNPLHCITWLADWLLANNPNKPRVVVSSREEAPGAEGEGVDEEEAFQAAVELAEQAQAAIKIQAMTRGRMARRDVKSIKNDKLRTGMKTPHGEAAESAVEDLLADVENLEN